MAWLLNGPQLRIKWWNEINEMLTEISSAHAEYETIANWAGNRKLHLCSQIEVSNMKYIMHYSIPFGVWIKLKLDKILSFHVTLAQLFKVCLNFKSVHQKL